MPARPLIERDDRKAVALLFVLALLVHGATAVNSARTTEIPLSNLAVFYDGHLYLEIAKSYPLPYSAEGRDYLGHAPGYPALIALGRILIPDSLANWGMLGLLASWLPAAFAAVAFYVLCKETGTRPFWPSVLFVVANPRWVCIAGHGFPEPLAMLLAISSLIACLRDRLGWCVALLSLAVLVRFPALLLLAPIAFGTLVLRRDIRLRTLALLSIPIVVFGLWNSYLLVRIPDFPGIWQAHQSVWETHPTWPFAELLGAADRSLWTVYLPSFELTYASLVLYLAAIAVGFRRTQRRHWILPVWVGVIVVFHAALSDIVGARAFTRLVILAWPAALLILWRAVEARVPAVAVATLCVVTAAFSFWFAQHAAYWAVTLQPNGQPFLQDVQQRLDSDEPRWPFVAQ